MGEISILLHTDQATLIHGLIQEEMPRLLDASVHAIITDPPYGIGRRVAVSVDHGMGRAEAITLVELMLAEANRVLIPGGWVWVFQPSFRHLGHIPRAGSLILRAVGIWEKPNGPCVNHPYPVETYETFIVYTKGQGRRVPRRGLFRAVQLEPTARRGLKPVKLLQRMIAVCTEPGDVVLDPFCGAAAPTLLASLMMGRKAIGIERDGGHAEAAAKAVTEATVGLL